MTKRFLVCDDDHLSSSILQEGLIQLFEEAECTALENIEDIFPTLRELEEKRKLVDIVFVDANLFTDVGLLTKIQEEFPKTAIVVSGSSKLTDELLMDLIDNDIKKILPKPYEMKDIALLTKDLR